LTVNWIEPAVVATWPIFKSSCVSRMTMPAAAVAVSNAPASGEVLISSSSTRLPMLPVRAERMMLKALMSLAASLSASTMEPAAVRLHVAACRNDETDTHIPKTLGESDVPVARRVNPAIAQQVGFRR